MDKNEEEKAQKETHSNDLISRRKFIQKAAYAAPVVMTYIASRAHAVTPCTPPPCNPGHCIPDPCQPMVPCPPKS